MIDKLFFVKSTPSFNKIFHLKVIFYFIDDLDFRLYLVTLPRLEAVKRSNQSNQFSSIIQMKNYEKNLQVDRSMVKYSNIPQTTIFKSINFFSDFADGIEVGISHVSYTRFDKLF